MKFQYGEDVWETVDHPDGRWYSGRNYDLFAILANVRNGRGFAGGRFTPILPKDAKTDESRPVWHSEGFESFCRGVPEFASKAYHAEVWRYGVDGHSHSWLTLTELLAYEWPTGYAEAAGSFYSRTLHALKDYAEVNFIAHDDLRIVFFFDN